MHLVLNLEYETFGLSQSTACRAGHQLGVLTDYNPCRDKRWPLFQRKTPRTSTARTRSTHSQNRDAQQRIQDEVSASLDKYIAYEYHKGDDVRVLESSLYSSACK